MSPQETLFECGTNVIRDRNVTIQNNRCTTQKVYYEPNQHLERAIARSLFLQRETLDLLAPVVWLTDDVAELYRSLEERLIAHCAQKDYDFDDIFRRQTAISLRQQLIAGILSLLRGSINECDASVRRAVEFVLFLAWAHDNPGHSQKWFCADDTAQTYAAYRDSFKIHSMLRLDRWKNIDSELKFDFERLFVLYEDTSRRGVHATVTSARQQFVEENKIQLYDDYGESLNSEEVIDTFYWTLLSHTKLIRVLDKVLTMAGLASTEDFRETLRTLNAQLEDLRNQNVDTTDNDRHQDENL